MIPIIVAQVVQRLLSSDSKPASSGTSGFSVSNDSGTQDSQGSVSSVIHDVGKLTTDALSLLGLGTTGAAASTSAATQAYAATGKLGH